MLYKTKLVYKINVPIQFIIVIDFNFKIIFPSRLSFIDLLSSLLSLLVLHLSEFLYSDILFKFCHITNNKKTGH